MTAAPSSSSEAATLGRGGGGGGGGARGGGGAGRGAPHTTLGPRGHGGGVGHGLGFGHHGGGWHGHHWRRWRGGGWWLYWPGYGWIVDSSAECSRWGDPLEAPPAELRAEAVARLQASEGDPVAETFEGVTYLFQVEARGPTIDVTIRPCVDAGEAGTLGEITRPEGRGPRALYAETLGDDATDVATAAANVATIQNTLSGALSPSQIAGVVQSYTGLSTLQAQSALTLAGDALGGRTPAWQTVAPLVAGAISLIPGVGIVTVAVVAAAVEFLPAVLTALGITSGPQHCAWNVGSVCFNGVIPYGPNDPNWMTWDQFVADQKAASSNQSGIDAAFPEYNETIGCELAAIDAILAEWAPTLLTTSSAPTAGGPGAGGAGAFGVSGAGAGAVGLAGGGSGVGLATSPGAPPPTDVLGVFLFLRSYYTAWQLNAEQAINGHPYATDADLLSTVVNSWNATHDGTYQYTFQPATVTLADIESGKVPGACARGLFPAPDLTDPATPTFVSLLLAGQIDGKGQPPLTIHVGQALGGTSAPAASSSSSSSSVALVVGGAAALGAALWAVVKLAPDLLGRARE